jgi:hypothetical protein
MKRTFIAMFAAGLLLCAAPARADISLSIRPVSAAPGATGTFDVLLANTGVSSVNIAGFSFELSTTNTDITFGDVTTSTVTAPYIFTNSDYGPNIWVTTGAQIVTASDLDGTPGGDNFAPGIYGLGLVSFTVSPGAVGGETATVNFDAYPATSFADGSINANNIPFSSTPGTITVTSTPEPGFAWPAGAVGVALVAGAALRRKRAAARA